MANSKITAHLLRTRSQNPDLESHQALNSMLRMMAQWRATLLINTYKQHHGVKVYAGLFEGMEYVDKAAEGCLVPRLLGCYESELHDDFRHFAQSGIDTIIDIGCAEGYYAVGLARMMPEVTVHAFDIEEKARAACVELATRNGVQDRVIVKGEFAGEMFEQFVDGNALVIIDAEGFEDDLMKPELYPALKHLNIIMETHPGFKPGVVQRMLERFSPSHEIAIREQGPKTMPLPDWLRALAHLDQLIAVWEYRAHPTPWLVMKPRHVAPEISVV